ncbi:MULTISPECIES: hypothetical protein [Actinoplanes]|uniref:hypothetical protein n=1 Tax=Actinoplanes TaxID=1865 RepID=UPI00069628CA|nr:MULTISPECIES: hypothetical protein [Actinoplanes]GLY01343.1 hypothetical protein Acsp01_17220 [Actinoplanes sp. NBRC 101535]
MWWAAGAAGVLVAAGVLTWALWPGTERPDPRSRVYTEASACLLTPAAGVVDEAVVPVWAGMQQASTETSGKVSYLEVDGPQTSENASTFLATLVQGDCDLVLAAGAAPADAVVRFAGQFPRTRFVAIGSSQDRALSNVVRVDETDAAQVTARVHDLVAEELRSATE